MTFKPSVIETHSRGPIGAYHWSVTVAQNGVDDYHGFDMTVSGVAWTFRGAKHAARRAERRRDNVRKWVLT